MMSDLHPGNVVLEVTSLRDQSEETVIEWLGGPQCSPLLVKDDMQQGNFFPRYLVNPASFSRRLKSEEKAATKVKIIDFGGGKSFPVFSEFSFRFN